MQKLARSVVILTLCASNAFAAEFDIQTWIDDQVAAKEVLAVTAAHLKGDDVRFFAGGTLAPGGSPVDENTQFQIGSISKAFTNLLLAEMVEHGKVRYDTTLGELLADDIAFGNEAVADITLLQLATHTSGLPRLPVNLAPTDTLDPYKNYDKNKLLVGVGSSRLRQPLGTHYSYSNFGVGLLGHLLGRVHGGGYGAAMDEFVIGPLGLDRTGLDTADQSAAGFRNGKVVPDWTITALAGAGALRSTAADMMSIAAVLLGSADSPFKHDLAEDRVIKSDASSGFAVTRVWHVADSDDGKIFWHNGGTGGFWSFFGWRPATNEAVVILVSGNPDPTGVGLGWLNRKPFPAAAADVDEALFGQYRLTPAFGIGVFAINGTLVAQATGQPPFALTPLGDDWFSIDVVDASVHFVREDGNVVALELAQNGALQRLERVADTAAVASREEQQIPPDQLQDYAGEYPTGGPVTFTIRVAETGLEAQVTGQPFIPIYSKGDDKFFYKVVDAEIHFERDEDGNVAALTLYQGSVTLRGEKSADTARK